MQASSRTSTWLFLITFALVFYGMGASFVESFVNYPTWRLIGANEFPAYHQALGPLIVGYMVIPMLIATLLTVLLLWFRPAPLHSGQSGLRSCFNLLSGLQLPPFNCRFKCN